MSQDTRQRTCPKASLARSPIMTKRDVQLRRPKLYSRFLSQRTPGPSSKTKNYSHSSPCGNLDLRSDDFGAIRRALADVRFSSSYSPISIQALTDKISLPHQPGTLTCLMQLRMRSSKVRRSFVSIRTFATPGRGSFLTTMMYSPSFGPV